MKSLVDVGEASDTRQQRPEPPRTDPYGMGVGSGRFAFLSCAYSEY
jgi:hypothetical protein